MKNNFLFEYLNGQSIEGFNYFGAHYHKDINGNEGFIFRLYAPLAEDVSVIGDFNNWDYTANKMIKVDDCGVFELFIPNCYNYQNYKFHFKNARGYYVDKIDPYAFFSETYNGKSSRLFNIDGFIWHDKKWLKKRTRNFDKPMSIYEMHLGSWKEKGDENRFFSYEEIADSLIPYLLENGFTHVELMPLVEHPFYGSWGYQATGFFSSDSKYGNPFQLMSLIDRLHQAGIGVILDFAPVHFARDDWGLKDYDGSTLFEYNNEYKVSPWGSYQFDLGKDPVRSFLMSAMNYFLTYFHFDGIRVDAVSNIIYFNGDSTKGINYEAVEFIKRLNGKIHIAHDSVMMIAEDSTSYPLVTKDTRDGGLGFDYKWDLGWMNDTLKYYSLDPIFKKYNHDKITFSMMYFYSDNFLLPLSHDEVVHGKGTILTKMWGEYQDKFALIRNLYTYQFAHPGKKLNFMGNEFASFDEWDEKKSLPWILKKYPMHDATSRLMRDLNLLYKKEKAMYYQEYNPGHFSWLMVDNNDQSIFAFQRKVNDQILIFIFNMTPNFYESYRLPMLEEGTYREIFNSDKEVYGGRNQYNGTRVKTDKNSFEGLPFHIDIKLASFGAIILKKVIRRKKK